MKIKKKILSKKNIKKNSKEIAFIFNQEIEDDLKLIIIGILLIETYYRNKFVRIIEYVVTVFNCITNLAFNIPLKNYTVGKFQIGLTYILNYSNRSFFEHLIHINHINLKDLGVILEAFTFEKNYEVTLCRVRKIYIDFRYLNVENLYRRIGEKYNGEYEYGILLEIITNKLKIEWDL